MKRKLIVGISLLLTLLSCAKQEQSNQANTVKTYSGEYLNRIAFPIGGIGAGMFCIEGTGALSHMSIRHQPDIFNEPCMFAAIHVKGYQHGTKVLEGPVPERKKFGDRLSALGGPSTSWGLPRFETVSFRAQFPFATLQLSDKDIPLNVELTGWSPFIPTDQDNSSLPVGALEYKFTNTSDADVEAVFSYNARNFLAMEGLPQSIDSIQNGFILSQTGSSEKHISNSDFAIYTDSEGTKVNYCWFRGGWWDPLTMAWNAISEGDIVENAPVKEDAPGASLYVPFKVKAGESHTIRLYMAWYVPESGLRLGEDALTEEDLPATDDYLKNDDAPQYFKPWYATRFSDIHSLISYWSGQYDKLKHNTALFTQSFYDTTLPQEVIDAVSSNLTILKSTTVSRQHDGRMWNYEGTGDTWGSCHGSCTHVWNYAQAVPHLFPEMERSLRETEFFVSQNKEGHQTFRSNLPIRPVSHNYHAASDGQLGGIIKTYRDWRISGDNEWLAKIYPQLKSSIDYCIRTWDPRHSGALEEPHHNTYDIEFWGADGMCTSFYASALQSFISMGRYLKQDMAFYEDLLRKSKNYLENKLYDGEYFIQNIQWKGLNATDPTQVITTEQNSGYSEEAIKLLQKEGPKYQYGKGCLSDGIIGCWMALVAGMDEPIDKLKVKSHLNAVYKYNLMHDLSDHANPQRPTFGLGKEGGLLLCTWPKGGKLSLPFVYSDEVWTGIEYQVASHLIFEGEVEKGLDIVRTVRHRYDGKVRNPFNEYECGGWYARALSSYSLLQALTGVRYDAVEQTLYVDSKIGDTFKSFLSTATGFGTLEMKQGKPSVKMAYGHLNIKKCIVSGLETEVDYTEL